MPENRLFIFLFSHIRRQWLLLLYVTKRIDACEPTMTLVDSKVSFLVCFLFGLLSEL